MLQLLPNREARTVKEAVLKAFQQFGKPKVLQWDQAGEFVALDDWLKSNGVDPRHSRPYHPQTNGQVERNNGDMKRRLSSAIVERVRSEKRELQENEITGAYFLVVDYLLQKLSLIIYGGIAMSAAGTLRLE